MPQKRQIFRKTDENVRFDNILDFECYFRENYEKRPTFLLRDEGIHYIFYVFKKKIKTDFQ